MKVEFTAHVYERMFERGITPDDVISVLRASEVIENYPAAQPFPAELRLGKAGSRWLHVVVSFDDDVMNVITVYEPDPLVWNRGFKRRRRP